MIALFFISVSEKNCWSVLSLLLLLCFCNALALLSYPTSLFLLSKVLKYCSSTVPVLLLKPQSLHARKGVPCTTASWNIRRCVFTRAPSSKFKVHRITPDWNVTKKNPDKIHTTERVFGSSNAPAVSGSLQTGDHQHMGMPRGHLCNLQW